MIHELLCIGNSRVDEPDVKHEEEEDQKDEFPPPFFPEFGEGILAPVQVVDKKSGKRNERELHRKEKESAVP
jgi:hypothetical protein